jgi:hypothetical protein
MVDLKPCNHAAIVLKFRIRICVHFAGVSDESGLRQGMLFNTNLDTKFLNFFLSFGGRFDLTGCAY